MITTIPVFYTPRQVAATTSMSPSAAKPAKVVASWRALGLPIQVIKPIRSRWRTLHWRTTDRSLKTCSLPGAITDSGTVVSKWRLRCRGLRVRW